MAKSLKFANVILCEYVASGEKNKHTLVNTLSGDVAVSDFPANLHFGLYIEYIPEQAGSYELFIEMMLNRKIFAEGKVNPVTVETGTLATIIVPHISIKIENDLKFSVFATCEGYKKTRILSKRIFKQVPPHNQ